MRLRRLTFVGGFLTVFLALAIVTFSILRTRPMGASISVHGYEMEGGGISASLLLTNTGRASLAVPLRYSCEVRKAGGVTTHCLTDTPYSVFLSPGDHVILTNALWRVRLPADATAWTVSVKIRRMSGRERFVNAVGRSGVASPRTVSRLAGQPSDETDYQWIECESSLLEIPGPAESHHRPIRMP